MEQDRTYCGGIYILGTLRDDLVSLCSRWSRVRCRLRPSSGTILSRQMIGLLSSCCGRGLGTKGNLALNVSLEAQASDYVWVYLRCAQRLELHFLHTVLRPEDVKIHFE